MGEALRFHVRPELREPAALLAFDGWNDAGESATTAAQYVADAIQSVVAAEIEGEEYFDFTVRRPLVRLDEGSVRRIEWPGFELRYGSHGPDHELVVGIGPEPHFRWRRFTDDLVKALRELGVQRVALLGAYLADVLYSLPVGVAGFASDPELMHRLAIEPSGYEGPTGIVGVLGSELRDAGFEVVSLWAGLPHYINASPNPRGALALLHKAAEYLELRLDELPLQREAAEFENRISELVASDPALSEYVKELKRREFAQ